MPTNPSTVRLELTDPFLRGLKPPAKGKRLQFQDDRERRLFVRVTSTGRCTWSVMGYLPDGQRVRPTLGEWPSLSIAGARKQAVITLGELAKGHSPTEAKRAARQERDARKEMPTVTARLKQWRKAKAGDWSERYAAEVERLCARIIEPAIGKQPLAETTRATWADMITGARRAPRHGHLAVSARQQLPEPWRGDGLDCQQPAAPQGARRPSAEGEEPRARALRR